MFKSSSGREAGRAKILALDTRLRRNHYVVAALGGGGLALMVIENMRLWSNSGEPDAWCEVLKVATSFLTLWQLFFLYLYYWRKYEQMKLTNALLQQDTFLSSDLFGWLLLEAALFAVHAPPFWSSEVEYEYYHAHESSWLTTSISTDELATLFMAFARVPPLVIRLICFLSGIESDQSRGYAHLNHLKLDSDLALRLIFFRFPLMLLSFASFGVICLLSFAVQAFERRANPRLDSSVNSAWLVVVSMTSVGYGDFVPLTGPGRFVLSLAMLWGIVMAALIVQITLSHATLNKAESRVASVLALKEGRHRLKERAARYVQAAWAAYLERLQRSQASTQGTSLLNNEPLHADNRFCRTMRSFRTLRKVLLKPDDDIFLIFKEVLDSRTRIEGRLRDVDEKLEEMDAKFEHNIAAMNELLQKNLKYLKHVAN